MNKSYKQFSLIILQLIIPLSTMTKAEYKDAYGIDLDDIDIEKVTLLQEEGSKNKYFVDEVKTTENGVDIYAGGKVLSIGSSVSVVNNAYSVVNAKPIYWHNIYLVRGGVDASFTFTGYVIILNNDPTPLTLTDFLNLLKIPGFKAIVINGQCAPNALGDITNLPNKMLTLEYEGNDYYSASYVVGDDATVVVQTGIGSSLSTFQQFIDLGVNKIN